MQSLSEVFEQPCKICGCKMEIVKELENINDLSRGYMRTTVLCRCKHGHEDVRELELDGQKAVFSASVYQKEEWEQKTKEATGSYKADSWIGAAGYSACGGEIAGGRDNG